MAATHLTADQKRDFVRDGFVVVRNAVPAGLVAKARDLIRAGLPESDRRLLAPVELATHPDVIGLFSDTCLADIMHNEMGPFPDVVSCQIAVTPPFDKLGDRPSPHVDGSWSGPIPQRADETETIRGRPLDAPRYFGDNDDRRGTPLKRAPATR